MAPGWNSLEISPTFPYSKTSRMDSTIQYMLLNATLIHIRFTDRFDFCMSQDSVFIVQTPG
jgi:hypothetical protein